MILFWLEKHVWKQKGNKPIRPYLNLPFENLLSYQVAQFIRITRSVATILLDSSSENTRQESPLLQVAVKTILFATISGYTNFNCYEETCSIRKSKPAPDECGYMTHSTWNWLQFDSIFIWLPNFLKVLTKRHYNKILPWIFAKTAVLKYKSGLQTERSSQHLGKLIPRNGTSTDVNFLPQAKLNQSLREQTALPFTPASANSLPQCVLHSQVHFLCVWAVVIVHPNSFTGYILKQNQNKSLCPEI